MCKHRKVWIAFQNCESVCFFNKDKVLVGAFSGHCETSRRFVDRTALPLTQHQSSSKGIIILIGWLRSVQCKSLPPSSSPTPGNSQKPQPPLILFGLENLFYVNGIFEKKSGAHKLCFKIEDSMSLPSVQYPFTFAATSR